MPILAKSSIILSTSERLIAGISRKLARIYVLGTFLERSKLKTPYYVSIIPAFWILVPGSLGFISLATLAGA
ncbi:MAG: threonine/serine exporter family protein, partial [Smithella sp.]